MDLWSRRYIQVWINNRDGGGRAIFVPCDVSQAAHCQRAVKRTVDELGSVNILFNNAGIVRRKLERLR